MTTLRTARLLLRPWTEDDAGFVLQTYSRPEVQRFLGTAPRPMADRAEALARIRAWRQLDDPVLGVWAVQHARDGRLLGTLLLKPIPASGTEPPLLPSGDVEIGWHLHPDAWGRGYATEAAAAVLAHAFAGGLAEVVAVTHPGNTASQAVCRRLGMADRGTTGRYYDTECRLFAIRAPGA